jgi:Flp pilus assembly protein TadD
LSVRPAQTRGIRWIIAIAVLEIINASYLAAFDTPSIFYHVNVILHVVLGLPLAGAIVLRSIPALLKGASRSGGAQAMLLRTLALIATAFVVSGLVLAYVGTSRPYYWMLRLHVASAIAGGALLLMLVWAWAVTQSKAGSDGGRARLAFRWNLAVLGIALAFPLAVHAWQTAYPAHVSHIVNPPSPPISPMQEGGGEANPFFPSSNETVGAKYLPSDFFLDSKASCGTKGCHPDITTQWEGSMHHFSSFNNQWYRKSIEYMQDTIGTKSSKWCGGCHDMAVLLTGRMDRPIKEQIDTPESQAGIGCLVCHSIVHVKDTMGQGGFVLEYPEMHRLASSKSPLMKGLHDYMTFLDPAPHRATMLKPFHRESTPQFCSACHKVHLDVPVNNYRWFRGFNEYDPWQQSGVSGLGARAFYYPAESKTCKTCHMPLTRSADAGNVDGMVHSHRFPGANTAVPFANGDKDQLEATTKFLKENSVSVDIFGVMELSPAARAAGGASAPDSAASAGADSEKTPVASSLFAGEEGVAGASGGSRPIGQTRLLAPLRSGPGGATGVTLQRGRDYLVEVVTRTRNVGHLFPGGTVDAFDVWVELKGQDEQGHVVFWSGWVADEAGGRKGPVDPSAHFYRSFLLDAHGNPINKRNAWSARALFYARLIPPGAADTTHFRVSVPADSGEKITFTARVNYRKFAWWNTQWAYSGVRDPANPSPDVTPHYDDGKWVFTGDTSTVSGALKSIPDLPVIEVAGDVKSFAVASAAAAAPDLSPSEEERLKARERYNDYGIGLLLQKDLKGAIAAFRRVTEIDPTYADGFVNIARAQIEEGDHLGARSTLEKALELSPELPKAHYFYALTLKTVGRYDDALGHLRRTLAAFPQDRVVLNQVGRLLFLKRQYDDAIAAFGRTLAVDPEDLQAHYNLMLCYRGQGDADQARREEAMYARFKADESSQELTGPRRREHPEDNNERLLIHDHVSSWTGVPSGAPAGGKTGYSGQ